MSMQHLTKRKETINIVDSISQTVPFNRHILLFLFNVIFPSARE